MDQSAFDRIARLLGGASTRRSGIIAALAAAGSGLAAGIDRFPGDPAAAANAADNRRPAAAGPCGAGRRKNACSRDSDCCTGYCKIDARGDGAASSGGKGKGKGKGKNKGKGKRPGARPIGRCRCVPRGERCTPSQTCCSSNCQDGRCIARGGGGGSNGGGGGGGGGNSQPVATGAACSAGGPRCADAAATCRAYASTGAPSGTFCLLADGGACTANADCAAAHCTGGACTSCTVCENGCPHTSISAAYDASAAGDVILIAPGAYNDAVTNVKQEITFRRCGDDGVVTWNNTVDSYNIAGYINSAAPASYSITVEDIEFTGSGGSITGIIAVYANGDAPRITFTGRNLVVYDANLGATSSNYSPMQFADGVDVTLTDCEFRNNTSRTHGGALHVDADRGGYNTINLTGCTFTGNSTVKSDRGHGGAIDIVLGTASGAATLTDCTFTDNTAIQGGGAIGLSGPTTLTGCTFTGNDAANGGAIFARDGATAGITDCTFTGNTSDGWGCIQVGEGSSTKAAAVISGCTISGNSGSVGAGIALYGGGAGVATVVGCTISGNTANDSGGGIYVAGGTVTINTCTISGNTAKEFETDNNGSFESGGGGLNISSGASVGLYDTAVTGNSSRYYGGGAFVVAGSANTTFIISGTSSITGNSITVPNLGAASGVARRVYTGNTATITGGSAITGNTTPPTQCASALNNNTTFNNVANCAFA